MNFVWMMLAFLILCGFALLFCDTLHTNMVEGMMLASSSLVLLLFLSSLAGTFTYGLWVIFVLAGVGAVLQAVRLKSARKGARMSGTDIAAGEPGREKGFFSVFASPAFLALLFLYVCWMLLLYHDFIQHIDEFHQWAAAVKYMLEKDRMPTGYDFVGGGGQYGFATSLFHLFFQKISGYNEQNMYVSSLLLSALGFMLPFSEEGLRSWKKIVLYVLIIYVGLFSLYTYGPKSMYVDVPTAAWAGGIAAWWMKRRKKKADVLIVASGFVMLHFFKQSAGLLMAVLMLVFIFVYTYAIEKGKVFTDAGRRRLLGTALVAGISLGLGGGLLLGVAFNAHPVTDGTEAVAPGEAQTPPVIQPGQTWTIADTGIELPDGMERLFETVQLSHDKTQKTVGAFCTKALGASLASRSSMDISFAAFVIILLFLFKVCGDCLDKKKECCVYMGYTVLAALGFALAVLFSYIFMFAYELSVELRSASRYFSIFSIYMFVILLTVLMQENPAGHRKGQEYAVWGLLVFLSLGLNTSFVPNATALDKENTSGYSKISRAMLQITEINSVIGEEDKVYFLNQYSAEDLSGAELTNAAALYYLEDQVSNYLAVPWKYTEEGSVVRLENSNITLNDFPAILTGYHYTYVWVCAADRYLSKALPAILDCDPISSDTLYRVCYEEGIPVGLEFVMSL